MVEKDIHYATFSSHALNTLIMLRTEATEIAKVFIPPVYANKAITITSLSHSQGTHQGVQKVLILASLVLMGI